MSVNARPASASTVNEIQIHSDDGQMSQQRQQRSPNDTAAWNIAESIWCDYIFKDDKKLNSSIFKVPEFLKDTKREAYVPQRVSLGPYHHASANLKMGHHKGRALSRMRHLKKVNTVDPPSDSNSDSSDEAIRNTVDPNSGFAKTAMAEILKRVNEIRESYKEDINYDPNNLAAMLCFDGCFILQILATLCTDRPMLGDEKNKIIVFSSRDIVKDVLMLENQVPFIVLQTLLKLVFNSTNATNEANEMLLNMVKSLLKPYYTVHIEQWCRRKLVSGTEVQHLLGFLYEAIVHPGPIEDTDRGTVCSICIDCCRCINSKDGVNQAPSQFQRIPPAVELRNAGIKFKPCHEGIEKIDFDRKNTTIFLPPICITDMTEVLFRNFIAFEMCKPSQRTDVSCYVNIMDNLIHSEKDVALLRKMGVLTNWLGRDKEIVDLFNSLSKATAAVNLFHAFNLLAERVNAYYEKGFRVRFQLAKLVQDYCSTPWRALASVAAIVLLVLALLQTIFSGIAVYK